MASRLAAVVAASLSSPSRTYRHCYHPTKDKQNQYRQEEDQLISAFVML